jgi:hypothetical protein
MSEDPDREPDRGAAGEGAWGGASARSPRLLALIALGLLVVLGVATKAGADPSSDGSTTSTTSTTSAVGTTTTTSTNAVASSTTTTSQSTTTSATSTSTTTTTTTTTVPDRVATTTEDLATPWTQVAPALSGVTVASAGDSVYQVTVHIQEATPGAHSIDLTMAPPPQSQTFADGTTFTFAVNHSTKPTLSVTNLPAGWLTSVSGAGCPQLGVQFNPTVGTTTCDYTFAQPASITVLKTTQGGDGTFTITEPVLGSRTITTNLAQGTATYGQVFPGTHHLSETALPDWTEGGFGGDCASDGTITIAGGEAAQCTLTNVRRANIVLQAVTTPSSPTPFTFTDTGNLPVGSFTLADGDVRAFTNVDANQTYTFTRDPAAGYALSVSGSGCAFDQATDTVTIVPQPGQTVTCVVTNAATATITIDKVTLPSGDPTSFTFTATGGLTPATFSLTDAAPPRVFSEVTPDQTYTITESVPVGWQLATSGAGCTATTNGVTVTPTPGQVVNCVFTDSRLASISVDKVTVPSGDPTSFSFTASGGLSPASFSLTDAAPPQVLDLVPPGQSYTILESLPAGWSLATSGGGCAPTTGGVIVTPDPGQEVHCVFTDTKLATITINKTAVGGDGTFTFSAPGLTPLDVTTSGGTGSGQFVDVPPGTYTLTETPLAGWSGSPSFGGACNSSGTLVVAAGVNVTCTVTNTKLATISIDKVTAPPGDPTSFDFSASGGLSPSSFSLTDASAPRTFTDVTPNQPYTISEAVPPGWRLTTSGVGCTATANGVIVIPGPGGNVNCTFTDTKLGRIVIVKTALPQTIDTTFTFTEPVLGPLSVTTSSGLGLTAYDDVPPGTYDIDEVPVAGWSAGPFTGACAPNGRINLAPGQVALCEITNTKFATITIDKTAVGGDATFNFVAPTLGSKSLTTSGGTGSVTYTDVAPGAYTLAEVPLTGWAAGPFGGDCAAGGSITVTPGQTAACSITNTRESTVVIEKRTVPPGDTTAFDFTAGGGLTPSSFQLTDGGTQAFTATPGQAYSVAESTQPNWMLATTGVGCTATSGGVTVTPDPGATVTCVFTNTKLSPTVTPEQPVVAPGSTVDLDLSGFPPDTTLTVTIKGPNGESLGPFTVMSDAEGKAVLPVHVPASSPGGVYSVSVTGAGFTVVEGAFTVAPPATTTTGVVTTTSAPGVGAGGTQNAAFAFTGSRSADLALLAAALLASGLGVMFVVRRRRRTG